VVLNLLHQEFELVGDPGIGGSPIVPTLNGLYNLIDLSGPKSFPIDGAACHLAVTAALAFGTLCSSQGAARGCGVGFPPLVDADLAVGWSGVGFRRTARHFDRRQAQPVRVVPEPTPK